jgi:hypothetical protein
MSSQEACKRLLRHFYHVWCGSPSWQPIAREHVAALRETGQDWTLTAGLTGSREARREARSWFSGEFPGCTFTEANSGFEQLTLIALYRWARRADPATPVLYAHTKGVTHPRDSSDESVFVAAWRRAMTHDLISGWAICLKLLEDHDAVGCCWLDPAVFNPVFVREVPTWQRRQIPFFGGNFWWANAGYAASLGQVRCTDRYEAERWIGLGYPRVAQFRKGWPSLGLFSTEADEVRAALDCSP